MRDPVQLQRAKSLLIEQCGQVVLRRGIAGHERLEVARRRPRNVPMAIRYPSDQLE
jgi:hypothetical protein